MCTHHRQNLTSHHLINFLSVFDFCMREFRSISRHEMEGASGGLEGGGGELVSEERRFVLLVRCH
jgi:hypothetical protein